MDAKEKLTEAVYDSIAGMVLAYAEHAIRVAWSDHRTRLDMREPSIALLDTILDGQSAQDLDFQTRLWGSYFGEVLRARFGGEWELTQHPAGVAALPTLVVQGSRLYPFMKVYRRLTLGQAENLPAFFKMVSGRLHEILPA